MKFLTTFIGVTLLGTSNFATAQQEPDDFAQLAPHLSLLNELSERRRPNSFFPNEQSQTYGVQVDYVNVGRGNLTFLRRDLVTVGRIPIVAARVYDSAADDNGGFGPGWRFALAETIEVTPDGSLHYTDESGSHELLLATHNRRFVAERPMLSDVLGARVIGSRIVVRLRAGWRKEFVKIDDIFRLVKVTDRSRNSLVLKYRKGRLTRVDGANDRRIVVEYNAKGRINGITDDQGRSVAYEYANGRLSAAVDLGKHRWRYEYNIDGQLNKISDPLNQPALGAKYYEDGRVSMAKIRHRQNSFVYAGTTTTVTNGRKLATEFTQGQAGITTKVVNAAGTATEIKLADNFLPSMLTLNDVLRTSFAYDRRGQLISMTSYEPDKTVDQSYKFGWDSGQIESMVSSEGVSFDFDYDNRGRLKKKVTNAGTTRYKYGVTGDLVEVRADNSAARRYQYNDDGQLTRMTDAGTDAKFEYDDIGRLHRVEMPDSQPFEYEFNDLGLRTRAVAGGSVTEFSFDAASRLASFSTERGGEVVTAYDYVLDADNLAREAKAHNGRTIEIDYDGVGNPISYGTEDRFHHYSYDDLGRFIEVIPMHGETVSQSYAVDEADWRGRADTRTGINLVPQVTASAIYGSNGEIFLGRGRGVGLLPVNYEPTSATLQALANFGFIAPDSSQRAAISRSRIDSLNEDFQERAISFNRPSNSFFLPPEMNQANCFQMCSVWGVFVSIDDTTPLVGQSVRFRANGAADDLCSMRHDWTWGDGTSGRSIGHFSTRYKTYTTPGTKSASVLSSCTCFGLTVLKQMSVFVQAPVPSMSLGVSTNSVRPLGTGGNTQATITVSTTGLSPGTSVSISMTEAGNAGHVTSLHTGNRPLGTLSPASGQINSQGNFTTTFTSSQYSVSTKITVSAGSVSKDTTVNVRVAGLTLMPPGTGYYQRGQTSSHPQNWYATNLAISGMQGIASDYRSMYYQGISQPSSERIGYNDASLVMGGRFDIPNNWCTASGASCGHNEHREGRNDDMWSGNIPTSRHADVEQMIIANGSPNFIDETATLAHWHLRF